MFSRAADHLCHYAVKLPFSDKPLSVAAAKSLKGDAPQVAYMDIPSSAGVANVLSIRNAPACQGCFLVKKS